MLQGPHEQQDFFVCVSLRVLFSFLDVVLVIVCCSGSAGGWIAAFWKSRKPHALGRKSREGSLTP